jgi:nucleotide-binding universal stress UspA family protein
MLPIKTILHPTDFSKHAEYGFELACALARDYGAGLILCHVKQPPAVAFGEFGALPPEAPDSLEALRDKLAAVRPADPKVAVPLRVIVEGDPATEIARIARENKADLIVIGTHGRTGLGRLLMGSVAEVVMRKATCPVLTVKTPLAEPAANPPKEMAKA